MDVIAAQLPRLAGVGNFRDFGGYPTADGRRVRSGMLFRSGSLAYLTDDDLVALRALRIAAICDLRSLEERHAEPGRRWSDDVHYWSEGSDIAGRGLPDADTIGKFTERRMRDAMLRMYREAPYEHRASYRALFDLLLQGRLPLLVHCAAGKDRTGIGVALVLSALGVDEATIYADYEATDQVCDLEKLILSRMTDVSSQHFLLEVSPEVRRPLFQSDPAYLHSTFHTLRERHGSIAHYLSDELGLDARKLARLSELLSV